MVFRPIKSNHASIALEHITQSIETRGRITFSEFMEFALYGPGGYYTSGLRTGARGDFFTSPHTHPAFGALIAVQLMDFWQNLRSPARFMAIEFGAGDGLLADDVKAYAPRLDPDFARALDYVTYDRAVVDGPSGTDLSTLAGAASCVLSNELLDAMPVHRFIISGGEVEELYVTLRGGKLAEEPGEPSTPEIAARLGTYARSLPEGYRGEVNLGIGPWTRQVASLVRRGYVFTIDYGHDRPVQYSPERNRGTLRSYYKHTLGGNPFDHVGDQDLTAHVDFTALDEAFDAEGFSRVGSTSQSEFLVNLGLKAFIDGSALSEDKAGMSELVKTDGLGAFRVVVHGRGVDAARPVGGLDARVTLAHGLVPPLPLLKPGSRHIRLGPGGNAAQISPLPTWEEMFSEE